MAVSPAGGTRAADPRVRCRSLRGARALRGELRGSLRARVKGGVVRPVPPVRGIVYKIIDIKK